jgi:hypothetical protein
MCSGDVLWKFFEQDCGWKTGRVESFGGVSRRMGSRALLNFAAIIGQSAAWRQVVRDVEQISEKPQKFLHVRQPGIGAAVPRRGRGGEIKCLNRRLAYSRLSC